MQMTQLQLSLGRFQEAQLYYPCCLLIHPNIYQLQRVAEQVTAWYNWPVLSIGTTLSSDLLFTPPTRRPQEVHRVLASAIHSFGAGPLLCTDIDILFEPSLKLDPLRLLRDFSRSLMLVTLWPGMLQANTLTYATPAHSHYRVWYQTELSSDSMIVV